MFRGKYFDFLKKQKVGKKVMMMSLFDKEVKKTFGKYIWETIKNPARLFDGIYAQSISLQQPNEFYQGEANLCDGCLNAMVYKGQLIPSCRLDEYRMFGSPIVGIKKNKEI